MISWKSIATDLNCKNPEFFDVLRPERGLQSKNSKVYQIGGAKYGLNRHCFIEFTREAPQEN